MHVARRSFVGLLSVALAVTACSQSPKPELAEPGALSPQFGTADWDAGNRALVSRRTDSVYVGSALLRLTNDGDRLTSSEALLHRYRPDGTLVWRKDLSASARASLVDLAEDAEGNVVVALLNDNGDNARYAEVLKYAATGQEVWRLPLPDVRNVYSVDVTPTGAFYLTVGDGDHFFVHKYSRVGKRLWAKNIDFSFGLLATDEAGNFYTVDSYSQLNKYSPSGGLVWSTALRRGTASLISAVDLTVSGNALLLAGNKEWVLGGNENGEVNVETDVAVFKYSLDGRLLWDRSFGTRAQDRAVSLALDSENNLYVAAYLNATASFVIRKYATSGQLLKQTAAAKPYNAGTSVSDMVAYRSDEVYLTGRTDKDLGAGYNGGDYDAFFIRLDGQGGEVWVR